MRAAFVNLPWEENGRTGIRAGCRFPNLTIKKTNSYVPFPFLLAYAAAYSESQGAEVLCIDGVAERSTLDSVLDRIRAFSPNLTVAEISATSLQHDLQALQSLKERLPGTLIAVYGSHTDVRPHDALRCPVVSFVIKGEPEHTSFDLLRSITQATDPRTVPGLVFLGASGDLVQTAPRKLIADLDTLPYPKRTGMPMDNYHVPGFPNPVVFIYGSRGCPYKCNFCLWPQTNLKGAYRKRPGEKIAAEMAWALEQFPHTRSFFFDDDTFNLGRTRILDFAAEMKRRKLRIPWGMNARADNWDRELMERLLETGLFTLRIGIESGDQRVLDRTRKEIDLEEARRTLEIAHELGIKNHVNFIIGLPGETPESVENTIRYIKSIPVDSVQFSVAVPFAGTSFHDEVTKNGFLITEDWSKYNGFDHVVARTEAMTADEIARAIRRARRKVYFSPQFIKRRLGFFRNLEDLGAITRKVWHLVVPRTV
jgi:anaerobic magnesium-protoporphyrin IX monomethyl ester cyclase